MNEHMVTTTDPVLNNDLLAQYRQRRTGLLERLIEAFLKEAPHLFQNVREGLDTLDYDAMRMNAHTLKSGSYNLGAVRLSAVCQELENAALNKDTTCIEQLVTKLGPEFFEAEQALKGELAQEKGII